MKYLIIMCMLVLGCAPDSEEPGFTAECLDDERGMQTSPKGETFVYSCLFGCFNGGYCREAPTENFCIDDRTLANVLRNGSWYETECEICEMGACRDY